MMFFLLLKEKELMEINLYPEALKKKSSLAIVNKINKKLSIIQTNKS